MDKKFDLIIGNPPYAKNLHLKIIDAALNHLNDAGKAVFIHPARWYQDPLAEYKKNSDKKKFNKLVKMISDVKYINTKEAGELFNIGIDAILNIATYTKLPHKTPEVLSQNITDALHKILSYSIKNSLADHTDNKEFEGWRCEIRYIIPNSPGKHGSNCNSENIRQHCVGVVKAQGEVVFYNGCNKDGIPWFKTRGKSGYEPHLYFNVSIKFPDETTALNFAESCRTKFYKNLVHLLKFDMHSPLKFLPYMHDYSKVWTDEDYCKFFGLTEEESEFMTREVYDYRVKDYLNYLEF